MFERIENFLQRNRTEYSFSIDVKDKKTGNTPLIWAAKRGHAKVSNRFCVFRITSVCIVVWNEAIKELFSNFRIIETVTS